MERYQMFLPRQYTPTSEHISDSQVEATRPSDDADMEVFSSSDNLPSVYHTGVDAPQPLDSPKSSPPSQPQASSPS